MVCRKLIKMSNVESVDMEKSDQNVKGHMSDVNSVHGGISRINDEQIANKHCDNNFDFNLSDLSSMSKYFRSPSAELQHFNISSVQYSGSDSTLHTKNDRSHVRTQTDFSNVMKTYADVFNDELRQLPRKLRLEIENL